MDVAASVDQVAERIRSHIMSTYVNAPGVDTLEPDHDLLRSGLVDSMAVMELVTFVEDTFGFVVADDEIIAMNFRSMSTITAFVAERKQLVSEDALAFRRLVGDNVGQAAVVLVVSHGDDAMLDLGGPVGWHFPRDESGTYAGFNPADGAEAIASLEALRSQGSTHVAFPASQLWWLDFYDGVRAHLESRHEVARDAGGVVYAFDADGSMSHG